MSPDPATGRTYLLVDGENLDWALSGVLGRRPEPAERPRWERVRDFARDLWGQPVTALFFLNASSGQLPMGFVQALLAMDFRPIPLSGGPGEKVVDIGILRTMDAIGQRPGDVLLASHDGDFLDATSALLSSGRRVGLLAFKEFVNAGFTAMPGLTIYDLEDAAGAFTSVLPRVRIIPLAEFDPVRFL